MRNLTKLRELFFSKTIKDTSIVFLGTIVSSIFGIIFTVLVARGLGPVNWGIVAAIWNLVNILVAVGDFGLGSAFFQYASGKWSKNKQEVLGVYKTLLSIRLLLVLFLSIILILIQGWLANSLLHLDKPSLVWFIILGFSSALFLDFQTFTIKSQKRWVVAAVLGFLTNVLRVCLILYLDFVGNLNFRSVLFVFSSTAILPFLVSFWWVKAKPQLTRDWYKVIRELWHFSFWMGLNKLISNVSPRLNILIIIQMAGAYEAGIYGAAERLAMGVPQIFGSLATILASRFASVEDKNELRRFFNKSVGLSMLLGMGLILGVFITPLVVSFFGDKYVRSTTILQWLLVAFIPFALSTPAVNILIYHFKKPHVITLLSILQLPIILLTNFYFIPKLGIFAPVMALGIINVLTMAVAYFYVLLEFRIKR